MVVTDRSHYSICSNRPQSSQGCDVALKDSLWIISILFITATGSM